MAADDKVTRIRKVLAERVEELAGAENRSFANMVETLLEQALRIESSAAVVGNAAVSGSAPKQREEEAGSHRGLAPRPERTAAEDHFRPDPKPVRK